MSEGTPIHFEHTVFVRRLAERLIADEEARDELVQDTWAAWLGALRRGGRPRSPRAWLARVLSNRLASRLRDSTPPGLSRVEEEAQLRAEPSVERELELSRSVLRAVTELSEPYRTAIFERYYRDRTPSEIAREQGLSVATVNTRLSRARQTLRRRLERELDGDSGLMALALLCPRIVPERAPVPVTSTSLGALAVKLTALALLVTSVAVGAVYFNARSSTPDVAELTAPLDPELPLRADATVSEPGDGRARVASRRAALDAAPSSNASTGAAPEDQVPVAEWALTGLAVGTEEWPLPGLELEFLPERSGQPSHRTRSDGAGRFAFAGLPGAGRVRVVEPGWSTVVEGALVSSLPPERPGETVVVAAPAGELRVESVDESGAPLAGVELRVELPERLIRAFARSLEASTPARIRGVSGEDGRWSGPVPRVEGLRIRATKPGYREAEASLGPIEEHTRAVLGLVHLESQEVVLSGLVLDGAGLPVAGADLELGRLGTVTDSGGGFHFDLSSRDAFTDVDGKALAPRLTAVAPGWRPSWRILELDEDGLPSEREELVIQLTERPLSIAGRVLDESGEPLSGALVFVPDAHLVASRTTLEAVMRGEGLPGHTFVTERTDEDGRFRFSGLLDEEYDVSAYLPESLVRVQVEGVPAGATDVELRIDRGAIWRRVVGQVVGLDGVPIAGVTLTPRLRTQRAIGPTGEWLSSKPMEPTTSDAEGRFELASVPHRFMQLVISHPELLLDRVDLPPPGASVDASGNLVDCRITCRRRMRFRIELDLPSEADAFRVTFADGTAAPVFAEEAGRYFNDETLDRIVEGRTRRLFVEEGVRTLVLLDDGRPVREVPLDLVWRVERVVR